MYTYQLSIVSLIYLFLISSCVKNEKENSVNVSTDFETMKISKISSNIKEIPLEFSNETMIGYVGRVEFTENFIFVHDATNSNLLKFDQSGKFISKIGKKGEGPGEYRYLKTFTLDEKSQSIYISSSTKLIKYNLKGEYIKELGGLNYVNNIKFLNNELKVFNSKFGVQDSIDKKLYNHEILDVYSSNLTKKNSKIIKKILVEKEVGTTNPSPKYFSGSKDKYYFYLPVLIPENKLRDTLYVFQENNIEYFKKFNFSDFKKDDTNSKPVNIKSIIKVGKYIVIEYLFNGQFTFLYDTETNTKFNFREGFDASDLVMEEYVNLSPILNLENKAYFVAKPIQGSNSSLEPNPSIFLINL